MRQRRIVAALCITVVPLVAACGAGSGSEQDKERATPYVGSGKLGTLHVGGARLVTSTAGAQSPTAGGNAPQAYLTLTLVNNGNSPQTLSNATVSGGGTVQPTTSDPTALTVAPSEALRFGDPDAGDQIAALAVSGFSTAPVVGTAVSVTLSFGQTGSVSMTVPVVDVADAGTTAPTYQPLVTGTYPTPTTTSTP